MSLPTWYLRVGLGLIVAAVLAATVFAAELAAYTGTDRQQRLTAGAKKEGQLNLYAVMGIEQMTVLAEAFEKKYGIKVNIWRSSSENIRRRAMTEAKAGRFEVDVVETGAPELEALRREQLLQPVKSPYTKELITQAVPAHGEWVGARINIFVQAYNTEKVRPEELPERYEDLLDPRWKGRLGVEAANLDWFAMIVKEMGEEAGLKFFRQLMATNGLSVRKGHPILVGLVASGEIPLALGTYGYFVDKLKKEKSAPIAYFLLTPAVVRVTGVGVPKKAPHPHAALLFYDFMLTDAQPLLRKMDITPANKKFIPAFDVPLTFVDPGAMLDEQQKWQVLYDQIIVRQAAQK